MKLPPRVTRSRAAAVFLERGSYRRRRLMDAARLLPLLGAFAFAVPLLWPHPGSEAVLDGTAAPVRTSGAILYIFGVWALLLVAAFLFGGSARAWSEGAGDGRAEPD